MPIYVSPRNTSIQSAQSPSLYGLDLPNLSFVILISLLMAAAQSHQCRAVFALHTSPPQRGLKRSRPRSSQSSEQLCKDLRRSPRRRLASAVAPLTLLNV